MVYYALILLSVFLLSTKQYLINKRFQVYVLTFICCWLICLISFRSYFVGVDTSLYTRIYYSLASSSENPFDLINNVYIFKKNKGWTIFFWLFSRFIRNPDGYIFISGVFITVIFIYVILHSNLDLRPQLLIYILFFYLPAFNITRNYMALALAFLSTYLINKKSFKQGWFVAFLAVSFHSSAIVIFFINILFLIKWNLQRIRLFWIFSIVTCLMLPIAINLFTIIFPVYESTLDQVNFVVQGKNIFYQLVFIMCYIYGVYVIKNYKISAEEYQKLSSLIAILVFEIILAIVGFQDWYIQRILLYFQIFLITIVPMLLKYEYKHKRIFLLVLWSILGFGCFYVIFTNKGSINPYSSWVINGWIQLK